MSNLDETPDRREVLLHRRIAVLRPQRIDVRPARGAVVAPLIGFLLGIGSGVAIWFGMGSLPLWLLAVLLIVAIVAVPFAGLGTVYALVGAHVVVDKAKRSATWQQGFLGMGVGTTELVPFWKIDRIQIEEAGASEGDDGQPVEEIAQFKIVLVKRSGKRLDVGVVSAIQSQREEAFDRAWTVGSAIAAMAGVPCEVYVPPQDADDHLDDREDAVNQEAAGDVDSDERAGEAAGGSREVRA